MEIGEFLTIIEPDLNRNCGLPLPQSGALIESPEPLPESEFSN